jgi:hypothetical protein
MIPLEQAEAQFDDALRNPSLTYEQRLTAARDFFFRAYQWPEDADDALRQWAVTQPLTALDGEPYAG